MTALLDLAPFAAAAAIWVGGMAGLNAAYILRDRRRAR